MDYDLIKNKHIKLAIEECQEQINSARLADPDPSGMWAGCFIFFAILLFPSIIFPLLTKWKDVAPYLEGIDISKLEAITANNSMHILFYAIPVAIVVTHGISASVWKAANSEVMKLRLHKLALLRLSAVLETDEILAHQQLPEWLLATAFDSKSDAISSQKDDGGKTRETGVPSVDLVLKMAEKAEKQVAEPSPSTANG